jgi:hypothetical protein
LTIKHIIVENADKIQEKEVPYYWFPWK